MKKIFRILTFFGGVGCIVAAAIMQNNRTESTGNITTVLFVVGAICLLLFVLSLVLGLFRKPKARRSSGSSRSSGSRSSGSYSSSGSSSGRSKVNIHDVERVFKSSASSRTYKLCRIERTSVEVEYGNDFVVNATYRIIPAGNGFTDADYLDGEDAAYEMANDGQRRVERLGCSVDVNVRIVRR